MTTEQTVFLEEILKGKNSLTIAELKKSKSGLKLFGLPAKPKDNDEIITAVQPALGSDFAFVKKGTEKNSTFLLVRQLQQTQKVKLVQESILKEVDKSKTGSYSPTTTFGKDLPMSQDDIVSILGNMIKSGGNESLQVVPKGKKNAFIRRLSQSEKEALILESLMKKTKPTIGFSPTKTFISGFPALFPNEVVEIFNQFLQTGRLVVSVDNSFKFSVQLVPDSAKNDSELFRAAFEKLDHGRIFVRICNLRRELGWQTERFNKILRWLRSEGIIQLHAGNVANMTEADVADCFTDDENRFYVTVTYHL